MSVNQDTTLNLAEVPVVDETPIQNDLFGSTPARQTTMTTWARQEIVPRDELALLIRKGELARQNDSAKEAGTKSYSYQVPESVRTHAAAIDAALADIKVCDPAIGSGAFPVGMMQEIVRTREVLTTYIGEELGIRTIYAFKRHAIQESLYGVDIDPGAVDIAKLRLWLSLVVDEDDYRSIKPLPNLDYKIVCGNSLLRVEKDLFNNNNLHTLQERQAEYIVETDRTRKHQQRTEIDELIEQVTGGHFDYELYFSQVFAEQAGFDVVIGNPPYVRQELFKEQKPQLKAAFPDVYAGTADLLVYFYAKGIELLRQHGTLALITSNKFMRAGYGKKLRAFLGGQTSVQSIIDFGDLPVFDASAYPCIVIVCKQVSDSEQQVDALNVNDLATLSHLPQEIDDIAWKVPQRKLKMDGWSLERPEVLNLLEKLRGTGVSLDEYVSGRYYRGIVTGLNKAFVINEDTYKRLVEEDINSAELLKPFLRGRDIKRWHYDDAKLYLCYISWDLEIEKYPALFRHLAQYETDLKERPEVKQGRFPWYALSRYASEYVDQFDLSKIFIPAIAKDTQFAPDFSGYYGNDKTSVCVTEKVNYLLGILNSRLMWWFIKHIASSKQNGYYEFKPMYVSQIPIAQYNASAADIENLVSEIQSKKQKSKGLDVSDLERRIDSIVYNLYDLTDAEIALVEEIVS